MNEEYSIGECIMCGKNEALKNGKCPKCQEVMGSMFPDIFESFMKNKDDSKEKE